MRDVHVWLGVAVLATNLLAGGWGALSWLLNRPSVAFWYVLRVAQATVVVQVLVGFVVLTGGRPVDDLHIVYGSLPLLVALIGEGARATAAQRELGDIDFHELDERRQRILAVAIVRRETGIMAASAIVVFLLALRAATMQDWLV